MTSAVGRAQPLVKGPAHAYFTAGLRLADSSGSFSCLADDACELLRAMDRTRGSVGSSPLSPSCSTIHQNGYNL